MAGVTLVPAKVTAPEPRLDVPTAVGASRSVPLAISVPPEYELFPLSTSVPPPAFSTTPGVAPFEMEPLTVSVCPVWTT